MNEAFEAFPRYPMTSTTCPMLEVGSLRFADGVQEDFHCRSALLYKYIVREARRGIMEYLLAVSSSSEHCNALQAHAHPLTCSTCTAKGGSAAHHGETVLSSLTIPAPASPSGLRDGYSARPSGMGATTGSSPRPAEPSGSCRQPPRFQGNSIHDSNNFPRQTLRIPATKR